MVKGLQDAIVRMSRAIDFGQPMKILKRKILEGMKSAFKSISSAAKFMDAPFKSHGKQMVGRIAGIGSKKKPKGKPDAMEAAFSGVFGKKGLKPLGRATNFIGNSMNKIKKVGSKTLKAGGKFFKNMASALPGIGKALFNIVARLGALDPLFKLFNSLLKYLGGKILIALMPIFIKLIEIMTSESFLGMLDAIAELIAALLIPALSMFLMIMQELEPYLPEITELIGMMAAAIMELISVIMEEEEIVMLVRMQIQFLVIVLRVLAFVIIGVVAAIKTFIKWVRDAQAALSSSSRKRKKDSHGDVADWVIGQFAGGTNYVPETGPAIVHKGEIITPAGENPLTADRMDRMIMLQEDSLEYQKRTYIMMRDGI